MKVLLYEAIVSCILQRNAVSSYKFQEKSPAVTLLIICKIIASCRSHNLNYICLKS